MSEENDKKLYDHYQSVIDGKYSTGNAVSNELKVSDAKRHLADLVGKHPELEVKAEEPEPVKETKKGKK